MSRRPEGAGELAPSQLPVSRAALMIDSRRSETLSPGAQPKRGRQRGRQNHGKKCASARAAHWLPTSARVSIYACHRNLARQRASHRALGSSCKDQLFHTLVTSKYQITGSIKLIGIILQSLAFALRAALLPHQQAFRKQREEAVQHCL